MNRIVIIIIIVVLIVVSILVGLYLGGVFNPKEASTPAESSDSQCPWYLRIIKSCDTGGG